MTPELLMWLAVAKLVIIASAVTGHAAVMLWRELHRTGTE